MKRKFLVSFCAITAACVLSGGCANYGLPSRIIAFEEWEAATGNTGTPEIEWWKATGDIKSADGKLALTPGRHGGATWLYNYRFPGSVLVETTVSISTTNPLDKTGFCILLNDDVPVGTYTGGGYKFQFGAKDNTCCLLIKGDADNEAAAECKFKLEPGRSYRIVAKQNNGLVSLAVNGNHLFSFKDGKPPESPTQDMVGFTCAGCTLNIEKLAVYVPKGTLSNVISPLTSFPVGPEITVVGPVQCAKSFAPDQGKVDHDVVLIAIDGSPEIKAVFNDVMDKFYPENGLDCDQATNLLAQVDKRLTFHIVRGAIANQLHEDLDYPSRWVSVTGTLFERDGMKWLVPSSFGNATTNYPAKMLAADKPRVMPDGETLVLKVTDKLTLKCIKLPTGRFLRGSPFYEHPRWQDEFPHEVVLTKSVYMAEIPVTQEMFEALTGKNPSKLTMTPWKEWSDPGFNERFRHAKPDEGGDYAVENAHWPDIQEFCKKLSEKNGVKVRLPTEGEWEWAARVGMSSPCFHEKYLKQRSFVGDTEGRCEPVKKHEPNAWGLYDMVKSGWELVSDYKRDNVRTKQIDPQGPSREEAADHGYGPLRRTKGGAFYDDTHLNLHGACDEIGNNEEGLMIFRIVVEVPPAGK